MTADRQPTTDDRRPTSSAIARRSVVGGRWSLVVLLALAVILPAIGRAQEERPNRAGLVIRHGDGRVITTCVSFAEPEISGADLLDRGGVSYVAQKSGIGAAVCKLDGEGCDYPAEDCFCHCKGADCAYWAYQRLRDGAWIYSQIGASATKVRAGDVDGWAWGAGSVQSGARPPVISFQEICAAPTNDQRPTTNAVSPAPHPTAARRAPTAAPPTQPAQATGALPTAVSTTQAPRPSTTVPRSAGHTPTTSQPTTASLLPTKHPPATVQAAGGAAPTRAAPQGGNGASATGYLAFGALALLLLGGIVGALRRRR